MSVTQKLASSVTPAPDFKRKGELMATVHAIEAAYRKRFDPEGKQRRVGFRFPRREKVP